ncbi:MAG: hypothetical protein IKN38_05575 [Clostridia bacterium]|nr:hypothetical protein [Clostridia bacterium]
MKNKEKNVKENGATFYRFAVPVLSLVTVMLSVLLWSYSTDRFGDTFRGYGANGRIGEVLLAFLKEPAMAVSALAVLILNAAGAVSSRHAMKNEQKGAFLFLAITVINVLVFLSIMYVAAHSAAS